MKIGIVGYQGSGKSTLFQWLTGHVPNPAHAHEAQTAMATVHDPRIVSLCEVYKPKKVTEAHLEMVDTPGLSRSHEGSAARLALIREAGCMVVVVASYDGADPLADLTRFEEDLLIADLDIVSGRIERLRDQIKKPRPNRDELVKELAALEPLQPVLEAGRSLHNLDLTPEQSRVIRCFQLFSDKPRLVVINAADDDADLARFDGRGPAGVPLVTVPLRLQLELSGMDPAEREAFCAELGVSFLDRAALIRQIMSASRQMLFFTAGDKEVRTWMIHQGGTAVEAAAGIHTDLAKGFIRAEVMTVADLLRLGSEREVKAHNLMRKEHKDYVIQDGEILLIQHN
jgi:hypothetical protein